MKKLIVGFSKRRSKWMIVSTAIRFFQKTPFSHVFFKLENDNLKNALFYQASGHSVNFMGTAMFLKQHQVVKSFEFEINDSDFYKFLDLAIDNVGKPYSIMQLIGYPIAQFFRLKKNPFGKSGFVCTELVATMLKDMQNFSFDKDLSLVDLRDIYNYLSSNAGKTI